MSKFILFSKRQKLCDKSRNLERLLLGNRQNKAILNLSIKIFLQSKPIFVNFLKIFKIFGNSLLILLLNNEKILFLTKLYLLKLSIRFNFRISEH